MQSQIWKRTIHELQNLYYFFIRGGPRQMWEICFLPFFNQLFPVSSLLSHLWSSLSCLPLSLPLHSHSLPFSSSIYSVDLEPLPCQRSHLKLPCLELPISPGVVSPEVANLAWSRQFRLELLISLGATLPRVIDLFSLHLADLSFSWCLWQCL